MSRFHQRIVRPMIYKQPPVAGGGGGGGSGTEEADFALRASGPGVVWYHNFDSEDEVNAFRWTGGYAGGNDPAGTGNAHAQYVEHISSGGADGGGYMRLTRSSPSMDGNCWWRPFSPLTGASNGRGQDDPGANGTLTPQEFIATQGGNELLTWAVSGNAKPGWYGHSSNVNSYFDGTEFYVQIRVRVDPRRTEVGNIEVGKFTSFTTTNNSYTNQELVTYSGDWSGSGGNGVPNRHNVYQGYLYSPLADVSTGSPKNPTSPQWAYSGGWDTLLYHISPGRDGVNETVFQVWAAQEGETEYTLIWDVVYPAYYDTDGGTSGGVARPGWNAFLAWIYQNGASMSTFWQDYDQIIFSKEYIPCPGAVPAYIADMSAYQVRSLTSSYAPANGTSTLAALLTAAGWSSTDIVRPWSGGPKSTAGTKMYVHGGGHSDSDNNGIYSFDFNGTTAPIGWAVENAGSAGVSSDFTVGTTGQPISCHTYDGMVDMGTNIYRLGGSMYPSGGFGAQFVRFNKAAKTWTRLPNWPGGSFAGMVLCDPVSGKLIAMDRFVSYTTYAFYREATNDWSSLKYVSDQWLSDGSVAWDPATNTGLMVANGNGYGVNAFSIGIDWGAETITQTEQDIDGMSSGASIVWDPTREHYWCWGGDGQNSTIYEINPTTFAATAHTLGTSLSPESGDHGHFGRFVFMDAWRAIGLVSDRNDPAIIIRLPS